MTNSLCQKLWPATVFAAAALLSSCTSAVDGSPTAAPQTVTSSAPSPTAAPPPGADLQPLVLPTDELRRIMNDPTMVKISTWRRGSDGLSVVFTPPQCSVVATPGMRAALDASGNTGVYYVSYTSTASVMVQVTQGVVGFADPAAARAMIAAQQPVWQQCANIDVGITIGDQSGTQHDNALQAGGDSLSLSYAFGPMQCMRTLAAKNAVVVDNVVCSPDPAGPATAILNGILDKVH
ncbi:sensor domain-containing protein [Mycolicibacterium mucogenicum]|uniref:Sensor domain-containing protein n=1 Tax=Mycolicibacterium mucogenicum DSM 44124 TaxID=1226753 RepID=A0A8H2JGT7_MYCMU|nr:sensor domain-containing protein [Mycolicibacterium mucogenicum]KAB7755874.1 hypothetical protein MMUC44124_19135 [Mycolicibacterium mucogenicum DSM 44124]QPG68344.1 sensor domain-containing protein [Mycolicibacterium mucogenicum DSM 44124]